MSKIIILAFGMFVLGLDAYVMAGLLPFISTTFKVSSASTGQTVSIFTICYALAAPFFATTMAGKPARKILVLAMALLTLANAWSAVAGSFPSLLFARAIAGVGAGIFSH